MFSKPVHNHTHWCSMCVIKSEMESINFCNQVFGIPKSCKYQSLANTCLMLLINCFVLQVIIDNIERGPGT